MCEYLIVIYANNNEVYEYIVYSTKELAEKRGIELFQLEHPYLDIEDVDCGVNFYATREEFDRMMANLPSNYPKGIESPHFQRKFGVKHSTIKYLEKKGLLGISGYKPFIKYGKCLLQPLYDASYYFMSQEEFMVLVNHAYSK